MPKDKARNFILIFLPPPLPKNQYIQFTLRCHELGDGGSPTNPLLLQVFSSLPLLELPKEFWNVHQEPEQMFCKINLSTYQQDINTYKRLASFDGLRMKAQHHSNTLQWKMHKVVKWCWYQESAGDLVQLCWILSSQVWACKATGFKPPFCGGWTKEQFPRSASGTHHEAFTQYNQNTTHSLRNIKKWTDNLEWPPFVEWSLPIIIIKRKKE